MRFRGVSSGKRNGHSQQKQVGLKSLPGSRQRAEVFDFSELKKQPGGRAAEGTEVKQAKVMSREQLQELAERHLVSLDGSRKNRVTASRDRQVGKPDSNSQSSAGRVIENSFSDQKKQTQSNPSQQQSGSNQSRKRLNGVSPGQSTSGAGNTSTLSLNRSQQAGGAHSEIKSAKNRQWQQSRSGIGFEREITVHVGADRILVGNDKFIKVDQGITQEELLQSMIAVMDQYVNSWGPAPKGFYWVPTIQFTISPGGNQYYERLKGSAQKMGLQTESTFTLKPLPVSSDLNSEVEK